MIASRNFQPLLIEGPGSGRIITDADGVSRPAAKGDGGREGFILLGYHEVPDDTDVQTVIGARRQIADQSGGNKILSGNVPNVPTGAVPVNNGSAMNRVAPPEALKRDKFETNSTGGDVVDADSVLITRNSLIMLSVWTVCLVVFLSYFRRRIHVPASGNEVKTECLKMGYFYAFNCRYIFCHLILLRRKNRKRIVIGPWHFPNLKISNSFI